jgi:hypothetical protein
MSSAHRCRIATCICYSRGGRSIPQSQMAVCLTDWPGSSKAAVALRFEPADISSIGASIGPMAIVLSHSRELQFDIVA